MGARMVVAVVLEAAVALLAKGMGLADVGQAVLAWVKVVEDNTLEDGEIFDNEDTEDSDDDSMAPPAKKAKKDVPTPTPTRVSARLQTPQAANPKPTSG